MAEIEEYAAIIDRAIDRVCAEQNVPRELLDANIAAERAVLQVGWDREARAMEAFRARWDEVGPAIVAALEADARAEVGADQVS